MNKPWMKWYPNDWRGDPRLRMCSLAARGLWADIISYMHEGMPYGHLTIDGVKPDISGVAALVARPISEVKRALSELEKFQVFSRTENGVIFSRRMIRDRVKSDEGRAQISKRWSDRPNKVPSRSQPQTPITPEARSQKDDGGGDARDLAFALTLEIGIEAGFPDASHWPPGWCQAPLRVQTYLDHGWQPEVMLAAAREVMAKKRDGPPSSIAYFERPFAAAHARVSAPLPTVEIVQPQKVTINGANQPVRTAQDVARGIVADMREQRDAPASTAPLRLVDSR